MELNRKELKKIIYDFNSIANRLLRADYNDYNSVLTKFLAYIDDTEIIYDYIKDCGEPSFDVGKEVEEVRQSYGRLIFNLGDSENEEVCNIYHILKYINENNIEIYYRIALGYSHSNKYQDKVGGFNERVVMVLIRHIEGFLTKIGIDMGMDEEIKYAITNNGQVNLATGNATINATQNTNVDFIKLKELTDEIKKLVPLNISEEDNEKLNESIEVIECEMAQPKPRKSLINTALTGLKAIKGTVEFSAAIATFIQFIQSVT